MDYFADIFVDLQARGKTMEKDRETAFFLDVNILITEQARNFWMQSSLLGHSITRPG